MRDVGDELALPGDELFDAGGHSVEVAHKISKFIVAALHPGGGADAQIAGSELLRRFAQPQDRRGEITRKEITDEARDEKRHAPLQRNCSTVDAERCARSGRKLGSKDVFVAIAALQSHGDAGDTVSHAEVGWL